nr:ParB/RepB/Spo0J family partition protein [Methanocella paludicola]
MSETCECIPVSKIKVDPGHIRKNPGRIDRLKCTVSDVGLLQPILVRRSGDSYVVIDGERRLRAMKDLAISELILGREVVVDVDETEADARFKQIIANVQRDDINHFDLGRAFVMLKEKYGYQYKEIAEIIGKTPHYVTSKVGLIKRLIPEVQEIAATDMDAAKCIQDTFSDDERRDIYEMNIKILEDIARLPSELQKTAYLSIRAKAMDINEALRYLRGLKRHGLNAAEAQQEPRGDLMRCLLKLDREIEALAGRAQSADRMSRQELLNKLESSIEKLNSLYLRLKSGAGEEPERARALV